MLAAPTLNPIANGTGTLLVQESRLRVPYAPQVQVREHCSAMTTLRITFAFWFPFDDTQFPFDDKIEALKTQLTGRTNSMRESQRMVRAAVLTNFSQVAEELGLNPGAELKAAGLSVNLLSTPDKPIPFAAAVQLLEGAAQRSQCFSLGMRMAERRKLADFGAVSLLLAHQRSAREAIMMSIQYRHLLNDSLLLAVEEKGRWSRIREELLIEDSTPATQAVELGVAMVVLTVRAVTGSHWRPHCVHFTHGAPEDLEVHKRFFKCRLEFDCSFSGITCLTSDLNHDNPLADPTMGAYARAYIETLNGPNSNSIVVDVKRLVYLLLPVGRASIKQVAEGVGRNVRTLQRELDLAGESFTGILNAARSDLALRYLENPRIEIARISSLLGYARPAAMTRWFTSQFGTTPQQWRKASVASTERFPPHASNAPAA